MAAAIQPLRFDSSGIIVSGPDEAPLNLDPLYADLAAARQRVLKRPEHAEPQRILADYRAHRQRSELGCILTAARRMAESIDRVVVVAGRGTLLAIRALKDACCHPYHNELSRAERGGQPRMYLAGDSLDNDALAGPLDLLTEGQSQPGPHARWGLIAISQQDDSPETPAVQEVFVEALRRSCDNDQDEFGRRLIRIAEAASSPLEISGCHETFALPPGAGGSQFRAAALLPAATLAVDVRRLLDGAAAMSAHFQTAEPAENILLNFAGTLHLSAKSHAAGRRLLVPWTAGLQSLVAWYENLLARSGQAHMGAGGASIVVNLIVEQPRRDRIAIGTRYLANIQMAAIETARRAHRAAGRPLADLYVPRLDESALGQLFQLLTLATEVERELIRGPRQAPAASI